jgi:protease-4
MKQFFKFFLASLLALIVAGIIFFVAFFAVIGSISKSISGAAVKEEQSLTKDKSILFIDLTDNFHELGESNSLALFTGGSSQSAGLHDLLKSIAYAKTDNNIKGIYLKAGGSPNGLATAQQIREALKDFKTSKKFIYAYGDFIPQADYFIASVADSVFINPLGTVELKGLSSQITFFKGALDKLKVQPEIFYCGQFKSATEPFRMDKMSEPNRKQQAALQKDVWNEMLLAISEHTKADTATINSWAQKGIVQSAHDAVTYKLADGLRYKDEVESLLRKQSGLEEKDKIRFANISDYVNNVKDNTSENSIAILVAEGEIVDGTGSGSATQIASETFIKEIRKVRDNDKIKAVVMRVNSPGGSALASEVILRELQLLRKKKPIVVSMGDLAASGGYYISCQADSIFALPNTITGSIGVFGMMFNTKAFFNEKLGVTFDGEKNAPYADFPNMNREMTDQEKKFIQNSVDTIYMTFKSRVAAGRKMDIAFVDSIGQGRVWTGTAGLKNGLVDALGGLDRAVKSAAAIAKLKDYKLVTYPVAEDKLEKFMRMVQGNSTAEKVLAEQFLEKEFGREYRWFRMLRTMQEQKNRIWMMMPYIPDIR